LSLQPQTKKVTFDLPTSEGAHPTTPGSTVLTDIISEGATETPDPPIDPDPDPHLHPESTQPDDSYDTALFVHYEKAIRGPNYRTWQNSMHTEILRLTQKTKSMSYKPDGIIPPGSKHATANPVIKIKLDPLDPSNVIEYRTRLTWGREKSTDDHPTSSSTIDTTAMKLMLNSTVSDPNAVLSTIDVSDFYLHSKLAKPAYLSVPLRYLPPQTLQFLGVTHLPKEGSLLFEVYNAVYGMDDAGRVSQHDLINHLQPHGYYMCRHTPGLFRHRSRPKFSSSPG
jgi:hypothetical protein